MTHLGQDMLETRRTFKIGKKQYHYFSIKAAEEKGLGDLSRLPFSLKIVLENLLRHEDGETVTVDDIQAVADWLKQKTSTHEIAYRPVRVLMQDFTGVPAIVDLAAMRTAMEKMGGDPNKINPHSQVDLIIDHSVQVDKYGTSDALKVNTHIEVERNRERYEFLRWGQTAFDNFRVVPPGTGICHQVNLEYLAHVAWSSDINDKTYVYPDTLVGTDSHTTMINGISVLGWGVGGIEAEAAMLGQPISMLLPEVVGVKLTGKLAEGMTATDLVLTLTHLLRQHDVVGKFVEFYGPGLNELTVPDRATLSNMAPEYGATCAIFPIDQATLDYLQFTGRDEDTIALAEKYYKEQGLWHDGKSCEPVFTKTIPLDLAKIEPSLAGPERPQDKANLSQLPEAFDQQLAENNKSDDQDTAYSIPGTDYELYHGDVVIAAITSCTNTSNPSVLIAAGLLAKKALEKGLQCKSWVKTSFAPGSKVVSDYFAKTGLQDALDKLGFNLVAYGCTTCIGNSGPLLESMTQSIQDNNLFVCAVLSGNRNFGGRIHPHVKSCWLASPPLVVAYALAGTVRVNLMKDSLGKDTRGNLVFLKDIWPTNQEIADEVAKIDVDMFKKEYADVFTGDTEWQNLKISEEKTYQWNEESSYIQHPPFFEGLRSEPSPISDIKGSNILALLGDSVTTDHISPAGAIKGDSPAGKYLKSRGISKSDFNSYGSRRGNHEVMIRGTFANVRVRNEMTPELEGGFTRYIPTGETMPIYDAAMQYKKTGTSLVIIAGKLYGAGSSRDWAAKGTLLLGVKAAIAENFERIHRSNLIGMGVLPLEFKDNMTRKSLNLDGSETIDITGLASGMTPKMDVTATITYQDGRTESITLLCRIDTHTELTYYQHGGILAYVLRKMLNQ